MNKANGLSVVIPVTERSGDISELFGAYRDALESAKRPLQFIFVLDGGFAHLAEIMRRLDPGPHSLEIVILTRTFGESAALTIGFEQAQYELVMTLPAYQQIRADSLHTLLDRIGAYDVVIVRRWPRQDSVINRYSARIFHAIFQGMTKVPFRDLGCSVRLIKRSVLDEITIYGDQHRFLPLLADRRGFRVLEVDLPQAVEDKKTRVYRPGVYFSRLLDLMSVFFVVRFTKKPLRFFGMVGSSFFAGGIVILISAVLQRYFMDMALADRPILLLGSLLLVLGVQLFALGLIGELIIFTHARDLKEYTVAETVNIGSHGDPRTYHDREKDDSRGKEAARISRRMKTDELGDRY